MKISAQAISCPQNSMVYQDHFVEIDDWALLGYDSFDAFQADTVADDELEEEAMYHAIDLAVDDLETPEGWDTAGYECHAHKDALGLVTVYFVAEGLCQECIS